jgi:DNA mismatch repair protein MutL
MTPRDSVELLRRYSAAEPARIEIPETPAPAPMTERAAIPEVDPADYRIIGEAFDCYVFVEYEGALLVIDKHAAHERVIFEELRRNREADGRVASQSLLLPITVILTPEESAALAECSDEIRAVGFELETLDGSVNVTAIPDAISASDAEALLIRMLDDAAEGRGDPTLTEELRRERALYQIACKAAIKGGRAYDRSIIEWLVSRLLALPDITVCPHGRPVAYRLTKNELDRQFERLK